MDIKHIKAKRLLYAVLLLAMLLFIFGASSQIGEESASISAVVMGWINGFFTWLNWSIRVSHHFVRKTAHFCEYALLGCLLMANLRVWAPDVKKHIAWPLFFGLLIPVLDEFFQTFVPERAGMVQDVLLDFSGVLLGIALGLAWDWHMQRKIVKNKQC